MAFTNISGFRNVNDAKKSHEGRTDWFVSQLASALSEDAAISDILFICYIVKFIYYLDCASSDQVFFASLHYSFFLFTLVEFIGTSTDNLDAINITYHRHFILTCN